MYKTLCLTTCILFIFSILDSVFACTSFAVYSNHAFYGMNFDFLADTSMKFLVSLNGDLKTFHLAFERMFGDVGVFVKTAGMNTKGLFASTQEQRPAQDTQQQTENDLYIFQLYEEIESVPSVGYIEKILEKKELINLPDLSIHNLFADVNKNAMITECSPDGNAITRINGNFIVMTNFANYLFEGKKYTEVDGMGADRFIICHEYLHDAVDNFSLDKGLELLQAAQNKESEYPTLCSMILDPQHNDVYICLYCDFQKIYKLSIEENSIDMWKGSTNKNAKPITVGDEGIMVSDLINHFN